MNKIEYQNCWNLCFKKTTNKLFDGAALKKFGKTSKNFFANIKFVSREEIRELNSKFRQIDRETDVLSFPNYDFEKETIEGENEVFFGGHCNLQTNCKTASKSIQPFNKKRTLFFGAPWNFAPYGV